MALAGRSKLQAGSIYHKTRVAAQQLIGSCSRQASQLVAFAFLHTSSGWPGEKFIINREVSTKVKVVGIAVAATHLSSSVAS